MPQNKHNFAPRLLHYNTKINDMTKLQELNTIYSKGHDLCIEILIEKVTRVLKDNNFKEFVITNGIVYFDSGEGERIVRASDDRVVEVFIFIREWDRVYNLLGIRLRVDRVRGVEFGYKD